MIPKVIFVLGKPGAGKGTVCQSIVKNYGFEHLSAGDLLRAERETPGSPYGELIESHIKSGKIVPVEITCSLIERAMTESARDKFLVDGFPRNKDNLDGWHRQMSDKAQVLFVLFLDCDEETCINRCLKRGAAGSGRVDDNADSLKKRFDVYHSQTLPIVEYYDKLNMVKRIDGSRTPEEVFVDVKPLFEECT